MSELNKQETAISQETVVGNEVTTKILKNYGVEAVTQEQFDKREEASEPAVIEEKQVTEVNEVVDTITDADFEALEKAGITEEQLEGKTFSEIKKLAQDQQPKQEQSQEQQLVISDAEADKLASQFPFAKNLRGKTISQVMEIIQNQNQYITQLEQKNNTKAPEVSSNSQTKTNDQAISEQESIDLLGLEPKEATAKLNELIAKRATEIASSVVKDEIKKLLPNIEGLQQASVEREVQQFYSELATQLPKDTDPQKVFADWKEANKNLSNEEKRALLENPKLMITLIKNDFLLNKTSTEKNKIEKESAQAVKKQSYDRVRLALKNSAKLGANAKFNFSRKEKDNQNLTDMADGGNDVISKILAKYEIK